MLFFASALVWSLFGLAVALAACWEWSRLASLAPRGQAVYLFLSGAMGACFWLLYARGADRPFVSAASTAFIFAAVFWIVAAPLWLAKRARPGPRARAPAGGGGVWPAWVAVVVLRDSRPRPLLPIAPGGWEGGIPPCFGGKRFRRP